MAKSKKRNRKLFSEYSDLEIFVIVLLVVTLAVVTWLFANMSTEISRYRSLGSQSNQACLGVSAATASGFNVDTKTLYATSELKDASSDNPSANQKCIIAGSTRDEAIHGKPIKSYSFGADVTYFKDKETAKDYAETQINPLRYWSPDPSNSYYTFLVTHRDEVYFDAYSVKDNAVMRISLPCNQNDKSDKNINSCLLQAERTIAVFNKKLSPLAL
ncbi:MAG TPA: hypothetical protein PKB09_00100 [Candidatus Saccharibacteria bacterium]|nr:hypothetical protein [Candidatus Saccharibacteria bacterium]